MCLLLTTLVVLQNEDSEYDASARLHVNVIRGLLVSLTFCICFWSRLQLSSSDAYGALALPWFLLLNSTRGSCWLNVTDASLLSSFSFVLLRPRHTSSNRSSALQTPRRSARKAFSSKGNAEGRTWLFSGFQDPICYLAKMLTRNAALNQEKELGVFFLCMQGLTIASVSVSYELTQKRDERVLVSTFVVVSCWLSFLLLITKAKTKKFHGYALACLFIFEMYLSNGILRALLSQIRGDSERNGTLTVFNLTRLAALWFAGCSISLALFSNRRVQRKEKILNKRKMFHAIAVVMFGVPMHYWRDDYGQILIPVAFATCLVLFCVVENLRVNRRLSNNLTRMMCAWEKERRRGKNVVVLSHSSLLLGIAVPLWLHNESDSSIASLAGLISIGIGDTFACAIGRKFGRVRINETKTIEGFLAFFLTTFSAALFLDPNGDQYGKIAIACAAGALAESTLDSTLDNLVIPLVFLAFVS